MRRLGFLATVFLLAACATGRPEGVRLADIGDHYTVTVALDSASTGDVGADIRVEGSAARAVALSAVMPDMGHAMPEIPARPQEPGHFLAGGELFAMPGVWDLAVRVEGDAGTDTVTFSVVIER